MNWFLAIAIFITSWFVLLFILLPIGVVRDDNPVPGQPLSAPKHVYMKRKMLINTLLSLVVTAGLLWLFTLEAHAESRLNRSGGGPEVMSGIVYPQPKPPQTPPRVHVMPCHDRVPATPSADLHVRPGEGAHGQRVAPADLGMNAAATHDLEHPQIPLYAPLTGQPQIPGEGNPPPPNGQYAPETYANFGNVEVINGQALLNGQPLSPPDACPE